MFKSLYTKLTYSATYINIKYNIIILLFFYTFIFFWHDIGNDYSSSDLFKEYLSKLLLETGSRGIKPVSFFFIALTHLFSTPTS